MSLVNTPNPPYYAVIFTSVRNSDRGEYDEVSKRMIELVQSQSGFLGFESAKEELGITVSYWESLEAVQNWANNPEHQVSQKLGKEKLYQSFKIRICKVEREYGFELS